MPRLHNIHMRLATQVVVSLTFLMAAAMLLIGAVMIKMNQRDLLQAKVSEARLIGYFLGDMLAEQKRQQVRASSMRRNYPGLPAAPQCWQHSCWQITVIDSSGKIIHYAGDMKGDSPALISRLNLTMRLGEERILFPPAQSILPLFFPAKLVVDLPLFQNGRSIGAVHLENNLQHVRATLWRSQKLMLLFIFLDGLVFISFGSFIFSRMVVRPIKELVKTAEVFQEGDKLPEPPAATRSELGKLSRALNRLLDRLGENQEQLRTHITSLEQANLELQRAQKEILMSEKMASVGRLAAGIAHEIGNPIGIILGYLELLRREDTDEEERLELLERMAKEIQRIHQIIRRLLDFCRPGSTEMGSISVHGILLETLSIVKPQFNTQGIETVVDLRASKDMVLANADQLKQVFLNLLVNAADAMAETAARKGGHQLRLETLDVTGENSLRSASDSKPLRRHTDPPSADYRQLRQLHRTRATDWIEVRICDTGVGIVQEDLQKVFDPFFSTKEPGKGTGLGLSVSMQIVEAIGGRLQMQSTFQNGTTVIVRLPLGGSERKGDTLHCGIAVHGLKDGVQIERSKNC
ncbi:MAG: HAMP domain-containing protein [Deltaproteobacteria bacterium]|nr:HAMP domain-containing protein [Deltaproteobacteria bacterium]